MLQPRTGALLVTLAVTPLLLVHLGASALWDDEANTAIFAANVWRTGDTNAFDGTNIIAFRGGLELAGIKNRAYPPLQYFYAAPFVGLLGRNAFAARLPFVLAGLAGFFLWAWWMLRDAPRGLLALTGVFTLGNVSLFLYLRQSRLLRPRVRSGAGVRLPLPASGALPQAPRPPVAHRGRAARLSLPHLRRGRWSAWRWITCVFERRRVRGLVAAGRRVPRDAGGGTLSRGGRLLSPSAGR